MYKTLRDYFIGGVTVLSTPAQPSALSDGVDLEPIFKLFIEHQQLPFHELTVTFDPRKYGDLNNTQIHNQFRTWISKYADKMAYWKPAYLFVPEYHSSGMLHYHGIFYFDNAIDYWISSLKRSLNRKFGRTRGKEIVSMTNWIKYIKKDLKKNKFTIQPFYSTRYFNGFLSDEP